jgi:hypothetical protein
VCQWFCDSKRRYNVKELAKGGLKMKTKSIRAQINDADELKRLSWKLAVKLDREVPVSEIVNALMEYIESAEQKIKEKNGSVS